MNLGIVGNTQEDITPFQRQVFEAQKNREAREKEKKMEQARSGGGAAGGRPKNAMAGSGGPSPGGDSGMSRSETVRYVNDGNSDDDTLEVID